LQPLPNQAGEDPGHTQLSDRDFVWRERESSVTWKENRKHQGH